MRIESVKAHAFGPFVEQILTFAPGLTVVWGPNETGKSSWHAALYAGLCGLRRSKGSLRREEREFARYRPWSNDTWEVAAVIVLDNQKRIELRHDLDGKIDCRAVDAVLGRDVSAEIMYEGSPDASRWLGLDRRSFLAIACVRQADVLGVRNDSALLQEHLQRAAATAGTDATAAAAIARIDDFVREYVGQDRANTTKPLRRARERAEAAKRDAQQAQRDHAAYLQRAAHADELAVVAAAAAQRVEVAHAVRAANEADACRRRWRRVSELAARHREGPPAGLAVDDHLAQEVAHCVQSWEERPQIPTLHGPSAAELRAHLATLTLEPAEPTDGQLAARPDWRAQRLTISAGTVTALAGVGVVASSSIRVLHNAGLAVLLLGLPLVIVGLATIVWAVMRAARAARREAMDERRAAAAFRRGALQQQLADREAAEQAAAQAADREQQLEAQLHRVARRCGIAAADPAVGARSLRDWQRQRAALLEKHAQQRDEWVELQTLLEGQTAEELTAETARRDQEAERLRARVSPEELDAARLASSDTPLDRLRRAATTAAADAAATRGQTELQARQLRSVAEAEEALAAADDALARVRQLADTLNLARTFLASAQERVHRDIARVLADTIRPWLPAVTAQRYRDVRIDPESLAVTVSDADGAWRDVATLSHGTAEQIYLLVRIALSTHLAKPGESCPLILDDVTVQSDRERTLAILQLLHDVSRERQVILFSQEDEVLEWAQASLQAPHDRVERLDVLPAPQTAAGWQ